MMFDDEDNIATLAQDLTEKVIKYHHKVYGDRRDETIAWWNKPVAQLAPYGPFSCSSQIKYKFESKMGAWWKEHDEMLNEIVKFVEDEFKPAVAVWVEEKFPEIEFSEREEQSADIQNAITSILGFTTSTITTLETTLKHVLHNGKDNFPPVIENYKKLKSMALEMMQQLAGTGFFFSKFSRWSVILMYPLLNRDKYLSAINSDQRGDRIIPGEMLGEATSTPSSQQSFLKFVFDQFAANPVALTYAMQDGIFNWLPCVVWEGMKFIRENPDKIDSVRPAQIAELVSIMAIMDHLITLYPTNIPQANYSSVVQTQSTIAWATGFLSCFAIKNKEMNHPYDLFAERLVAYFTWSLLYAKNSGGYVGSNCNILERWWKECDVFNRQICLSKKSQALVAPVFDLIKEISACLFDGLRLPATPKELKPKLGDLIAMLSADQLEGFSNPTGGYSAYDSSDMLDYWASQRKDIFAKVEKGEVIEPKQWKGEKELGDDVSPLEFFQHEAKKEVDVIKIFGKIQYVTGVYDYRVKIVDSGPADLTVEMVGPKVTRPLKSGEWKLVTAFPDYKIKIVKAGTYDFTIKL